jgi:glycosyltransferase involved in cell wall biosynthesis
MRLTVLNVSYPLAPVSPATAGGAEQVLLTIDRALVNAGHRSIVIAPAGSKCCGFLIPTAPVGRFLNEEAKQRSRREHAEAIERTLHSFPVDVVHLHGIDFLDYLPRSGVPVIVTLHLPPHWYPKAAFRLERPETSLVCVSASQRKACPLGARIEATVHNGVGTEVQVATKKGDYILSLGRICPEKGFHLALDAADRCGMPLFLAGQVFDYPEHRTYFEEFIRPRLHPPHKFLGPIGGKRKRELMRGARCVLISSTAQETSSLVAMEAMASGTPVIAFRKGALPEIIQHGRTGFLVDSVEEMAEAVLNNDSLDPNVCIQTVQTRFSAERMTSGYLGLYRRIVERRTFIEREVAC